MRKNRWMDYCILSEIVMIGLAEAAHLAAILLDWTFSMCSLFFMGLTGVACIMAAGGLALKSGLLLRGHMGEVARTRQKGQGKTDGGVWGLLAVFAVLVLSQVLFICKGGIYYLQGDMTVEAVESFLASDRIYQWNPMTGQPYTQGIPMRLKILCLPTLYGSLCGILGLKPAILIRTMVPILTLTSSYVAFYALGCSLFPKSGDLPEGAAEKGNMAKGTKDEICVVKKRVCFLLVVALLFWAETYFHVMDGFQLLFCGWRGTAIRNSILLPWLFSLCLRKKWCSAVLCVLAEACLVWTFYGMGVCVIAVVGMILGERYTRRGSKTVSEKHSKNSSGPDKVC